MTWNIIQEYIENWILCCSAICRTYWLVTANNNEWRPIIGRHGIDYRPIPVVADESVHLHNYEQLLKSSIIKAHNNEFNEHYYKSQSVALIMQTGGFVRSQLFCHRLSHYKSRTLEGKTDFCFQIVLHPLSFPHKNGKPWPHWTAVIAPVECLANFTYGRSTAWLEAL